MKNIFKILLASILLVFTISQPSGKYCGDIFGNTLSVELNSSSSVANITANIFGQNSSCPKEKYFFNKTDYSINMPSKSTDCLNTVLERYDACPCPPHIIYNNKDNKLTILDTTMGSVPLESC